ncbi:MAG: hypothetical protein EAZ97_13280 [Bacteroidetes bacterium]|nr:MAG: hypothetical protein EAZ97_13280 [Bacteroidota bacterium]
MKTLIYLFLLISIPVFAQKNKLENFDLDGFVQQIFAVQKEDLDYSDLYESFYQLYLNPLDLNQATREDLEGLYVLSEMQINNFFAHTTKNGKFVSIYELQAIESFDLPTIQRILPFVALEELNSSQSLFQRILNEKNNFLIIRPETVLENRKGYQLVNQGDTVKNAVYAGSQERFYSRFRVSHSKDFSIGFTLEKDAGEKMNYSNPFSADFQSYHAVFYNKKRFKALAIGDFQIQIGQGLLLSGGFYIGKGAETVSTIRRSSTGIRPYTSVVESGFLRGLAGTYRFGQFDLTSFVSYNRQDAGLQFFASDTLNDAQAYTNSIMATGLHRTAREIASKDQIGELTFGSNLTFRNKKNTLEIGLTALESNFSAEIIPLNRIYNQFEFKGTKNRNFGLNYSYVWQNMNFFGEIARSSSGGIGAVSGILANLSKTIEMSLLFRHYDRNFHTFYGTAFSENTRNINEQGIYWGIKFKPNKKWTWTAYYDQFQFEWLKFLVDAPSQGNEFLTRITHQASKTVQIYAQFRQETKGRNLSNNLQNIDLLVPSVKQNIQINADVNVHKTLFLRSRVQFSSYQQQNQAKTSGYAIIQDVSTEFKNFKVSARFALFDTDDYENRQYSFEKDVLYAFTIPAYYGRGIRNYILFQWKMHKKLDFWLRYAITSYQNQEKISSGTEKIDGNQRSDLRFQIKYVF